PIAEISANASNLKSKLEELIRLWKNDSLFSIGFFTYESTLPFTGVTSKFSEKLSVPLFHFLFYESVLKIDHLTGEIEATNPVADNYSDLIDSPKVTQSSFQNGRAKVIPEVSKDEYFRNIQKIKEHIKEGDIYQANYTCRFNVTSSANPFSVYHNLRSLNPAPYAAFLNFGDYQIISSSPERMFKRTGDFISSCPIKGTIKSGNGEKENRQQIEKLLDSEKDKAELLMIVDLMRNDLGKIARTGSVEVSNLFTAEPYSSLIHLVTDVSATLKEDVHYLQIISALMPGGSITGAPKKSAVQILQEHESTPRGVYTGCIGYVNGKNADFNIAIRTITHQNGQYEIHAGGGIVADSDPESEFNEMQLKAKNLFGALGISAIN
ncbi:MAG TPA: aminodeoxychorismate synthase component I, partial [candidate division Zixibacteria bacterium]|nr:aminodeoxychorismate synthase component I [candidate division Zixibacteria bacterium]